MDPVPFPAGPFSVAVKQPAAIDSADRILIDEDCLRFGQSTAVGRTDWTVTVPFSDIVELEYEASGGKVSGSLRDGAFLGFRVDQTLACEVAMRALEDLLTPGAGRDDRAGEEPVPDDRGSGEWSRSVEDAFAAAGRCGVEDQVRRFARLAVDAGFEVERLKKNGPLVARWPGTTIEVLDMHWYEWGRCHIYASRTGAFGADEPKAMRALPKQKLFHTMDVAETDQFLDALEAFLLSHPVEKAPRHLEERKREQGFENPMEGQNLQRRAPLVSDEELASVLRSLEVPFEDAAECGVERQVRRFAELAAAADLDVRWIEGARGLGAVWRRTGEAVFELVWSPGGQVAGSLGVDKRSGDVGVVYWERAYEAFELDPEKAEDRLPDLRYTHKMSTVDVNRYTDGFLDWLEMFLASHSIPPPDAEAVWQEGSRRENRGCLAALLALSSVIWFGIVQFLLNLLPGDFPSDEPIGFAVRGLLSAVVPILAIIKGLAARRELAAHIREHPDAPAELDTAGAWTAIIIGAVLVFSLCALFVARVTR